MCHEHGSRFKREERSGSVGMVNGALGEYNHCFSVFQVGCNLVHGLYGEVTLINLYAMHLLEEEFCKLVAV